MSKTEAGLFQALENELRNATEPLDCHDLFDRAVVKEHATSPNRVSDYLGNLWRKGLVVRLPAPKGDNTRARWQYVWKGKVPTKKKADISEAIEFSPRIHSLLNKPHLEITEEGDTVIITLPHISITIRQRHE